MSARARPDDACRLAPQEGHPKRRPESLRRGTVRGFSLIELMVSMAIGLVITVAIAAVMISSENDKRGSTAVNDVNQSGSYAAYVLDRQIRSAGSGYAQRWTDMIGCTLFAQNASGRLLPRSAAFPATSPFVNWTAPITLAPVVIGKNLGGTGGDLLIVQTGTAGLIEQPAAVLPGISAGQMRLNNTLGYRGGDILLLADSDAPVTGKCMVQQIASGFAGGTSQAIPLGGTYAVSSIGSGSNSVSVTGYATGTNAIVAQLGNLDNKNLPQFSLIGVGANSTLYSTELLPSTGPIDDQGQAIADGVVEVRALYGIATPTGPAFVAPDSTGFGVGELTAGAAAQANLKKIVSIRIGLILRTSIGEAKPIYPATATIGLFTGLSDANTGQSLALTRSIGAGAGPYYRYRSVELTIPMRNVMLAP